MVLSRDRRRWEAGTVLLAGLAAGAQRWGFVTTVRLMPEPSIEGRSCPLTVASPGRPKCPARLLPAAGDNLAWLQSVLTLAGLVIVITSRW